jgi:hypothetical protein
MISAILFELSSAKDLFKKTASSGVLVAGHSHPSSLHFYENFHLPAWKAIELIGERTKEYPWTWNFLPPK